MALAAVIVSVLALCVSGVSVAYTRRVAHTAEAADRRARTPQLTLTGEDTRQEDARSIFYVLRNDGPQDLESVVIHRPRPPDGIAYPVAQVGGDWAEDAVELGPLPLAQEVRFVLSIGSARQLPEFRSRIRCRAGRDVWLLTQTLELPSTGRASTDVGHL